jgi:micrococcal nuclease
MWSKLLFLLVILILGFVALKITLPEVVPEPPLTTPDLHAPTAALEPTPVSTPLAAPTPTPTEVTPTAVSRVEAVVINVVDGDTIDVLIDGQEYRVRYMGIDAPETVHPTRGEAPYGREAFEFNKALVEGRKVFLEKEVGESEQLGPLLRYVWLEDGTMVNALLVAGGYAQVSTFPPDGKYAEDFLILEGTACQDRVGLWGCDPSYPAVCIPCPPPGLACREIRDKYGYEDIKVLQPDPHRLDWDGDGVGCES